MNEELRALLADTDRPIPDRLEMALRLPGLTDEERASIEKAANLDTGAATQWKWLEMLVAQWVRKGAVGAVRLEVEE